MSSDLKSRSSHRYGGLSRDRCSFGKNKLREMLQDIEKLVDERSETDSTSVIKNLLNGLQTWSDELYSKRSFGIEKGIVSRNFLNRRGGSDDFLDHTIYKSTQQEYNSWSKKSINIDIKELDERDLSEDVYSILLICKYKSHAMLFSLGVVIFQFSVMTIILIDGFAGTSKMPVYVGVDIRISQALAIPLMLATQDDLIHGISCLFDGYDPAIKDIAPHATKEKFVLVYCLQVAVGTLYLVSIMQLIIKSDTVISLFLNFAALSFISFIDDVFFLIARNFMITDHLGVLTRQLKNVTIPIPKKTPSIDNPVSTYRAMNLLYVICILYIYFGLLCLKQIEGQFACQSILVQFGDETIPGLGRYAGAYDRIQKIGSVRYKINDRFVYLHRDTNRTEAIFAYCSEQHAWTFAPLDDREPFHLYDPCKNFTLKSRKTKTYDIIEALERGMVKPDNSGIDDFSMRCNKCKDCNGGGQCVNHRCVCDDGNYGINCEFQNDFVCKEIYPVNQWHGTESEPFSIYRYSESPTTTYFDRPIYVREKIIRNDESSDIFKKDNNSSSIYEVVMFIGRRWAYYHSRIFEGGTNKTTTKSLEEFVTVLIKDKVVPFQYSDPIQFGGYRDSASPIQVLWNSDFYSKEIYFDQFWISAFVCEFCSKKSVYPCNNGGQCVIESGKLLGKCKCPHNFRGYTCEEFFNDNKS